MNLLHIDSSILGDNSVSRQISAAIVARLTANSPAATVIVRDLVAAPIDHLTLADVSGANGTAVLDEFLAADTIVIGAPMYNFTLPSQLKAWIDRILVAGKTFRYAETGPEGLAGGKRVIVALSRGGLYSPGHPAADLEHLETYLGDVFGFIGITPEFVVSEGINLGPDARAAAIAASLAQVDTLAA